MDRLLLIIISTGALLITGSTEKVNCTENVSCKSCINGTYAGKCAWCSTSETCLAYDPMTDITTLKECGKDFYASNCVVNHKLVIIGVGVGVGLLLIAISFIAIWCCCCKGKKAQQRKIAKEEAEWQKQRDQIAMKHETSRAERQEKHDAIRLKYGLKKPNTYERFD